MPPYVIAIDVAGIMLMILGIHLAFRQNTVRLWWSRLHRGSSEPLPPLTDGDPQYYVMRISGVMIMVFGFVISMMFTLVAISG